MSILIRLQSYVALIAPARILAMLFCTLTCRAIVLRLVRFSAIFVFQGILHFSLLCSLLRL